MTRGWGVGSRGPLAVWKLQAPLPGLIWSTLFGVVSARALMSQGLNLPLARYFPTLTLGEDLTTGAAAFSSVRW